MNHNICVLSLIIFSLHAVIKYIQKYRQYHEQRPIRTSQCFRKTKIQSSGASFVSFWQSKQKWKHFRTWWKMKYKWLRFYNHIKGAALARGEGEGEGRRRVRKKKKEKNKEGGEEKMRMSRRRRIGEGKREGEDQRRKEEEEKEEAEEEKEKEGWGGEGGLKLTTLCKNPSVVLELGTPNLSLPAASRSICWLLQ